MKYFFFCILFLLGCQNSYHQNSYLNLDFEQVSMETFDYWMAYPEQRIIIDSLNPKSGKYCAVIQSNQLIFPAGLYFKSDDSSNFEVEFSSRNFDLKEINLLSLKFIVINELKEEFEINKEIEVNSAKWNKILFHFSLPNNYLNTNLECNLIIENRSTNLIMLDDFNFKINKKKFLFNKMVLSKKDRSALNNKITPLNINNGIEKNNYSFLSDLVDKKSFVMLGEATHGTKEIFLTKNSIIKYLVEQENFNTIIFEGNTGDLDLANEFLKNDAINGVDSALTKVFGVYQTQEIKDLFHWIQKYNNSNDENIQLMGCDVQSDKAPIKYLLDYGKSNNKTLVNLLKQYKKEYKIPELMEILKKMRMEIESTESKDKMILLGKILEIEQFVKEDSGMETRDYQMAFNINKILKENKGNKAIYWAHNLHCARKPSRVGGILESEYKIDFFSIGIMVGKGDYRARPSKSTLTYTEGNELIKPPIRFSYEYLLNSLNEKSFFFLASDFMEHELFQQKRTFRSIGHTKGFFDWGFDRGKEVIIDDFDSYIFIKESTSALGLAD